MSKIFTRNCEARVSLLKKLTLLILVAIGKKRNIGLNGGCVPNIFKCYTRNLLQCRLTTGCMRCPSDTNAVERKNRESKDSTPLPIQQAMINRYKADKFVCAKQVAAEHEVKITYHDKSESL